MTHSFLAAMTTVGQQAANNTASPSDKSPESDFEFKDIVASLAAMRGETINEIKVETAVNEVSKTRISLGLDPFLLDVVDDPGAEGSSDLEDEAAANSGVRDNLSEDVNTAQLNVLPSSSSALLSVNTEQASIFLAELWSNPERSRQQGAEEKAPAGIELETDTNATRELNDVGVKVGRESVKKGSGDHRVDYDNLFEISVKKPLKGINDEMALQTQKAVQSTDAATAPPNNGDDAKTKIHISKLATHLPIIISNSLSLEKVGWAADRSVDSANQAESRIDFSEEPSVRSDRLRVIHFDVEPAGLGEITVKMRIRESHVHIEIAAQSSSTSALISHARDALSSAIEHKGMVLQAFEVMTMSSSPVTQAGETSTSNYNSNDNNGSTNNGSFGNGSPRQDERREEYSGDRQAAQETPPGGSGFPADVML